MIGQLKRYKLWEKEKTRGGRERKLGIVHVKCWGYLGGGETSNISQRTYDYSGGGEDLPQSLEFLGGKLVAGASYTYINHVIGFLSSA